MPGERCTRRENNLLGFFCLYLQEFFQGLESHMILTEMYFSKSSALTLPKERQALKETLDEAQSVLKDAHSKGVELEFILEVRDETIFLLSFTLYLCTYV